MSIFDDVEWDEVRRHYDLRVETHKRIIHLHDGGLLKEFFELAMGIKNDAGNYSAAEHGIGPRVAYENNNSEDRVFKLATELRGLKNGRSVPKAIRDAGLRYLSIGVGSEMSCMMNPTICWVANTRTIWTHLVVKHADNIAIADEALMLYRDNDVSSEMAYKIWTSIHQELDTAMTRISEIGNKRADDAGIEPGPMKYIWADAISNYLYSSYR